MALQALIDNDNKFDIHNMIVKGLGIKEFKKLIDQSELNISEWSQLLDVPMRTLQRYLKNDKLLKSSISDLVIEYKEIEREGIEAFGKQDKFVHWLKRENWVFNNYRPLDLFKSFIGRELIREEIHRIEHGIFV